MDMDYVFDDDSMMNDDIEYITAHSKELAEEATAGNEKAQSVIGYYRLFNALPEFIASALCKAALEDYKKSKKPTT